MTTNQFLPCIFNEKLLLFLDYDGTLTPIVDDPMNAKLADEQRLMLKTLNTLQDVEVVLISGRTCDELQQLVNISNIPFLCNHGIYMVKNSCKYSIVDQNKLEHWVEKMKLINSEINDLLVNYKNIWLENKKYGFALHTRGASEEQKHQFIELLDEKII